MDEGVVPVVMRLLREHAVEGPCGGDGYFLDFLAPPSRKQDRPLDRADDRFRSRSPVMKNARVEPTWRSSPRCVESLAPSAAFGKCKPSLELPGPPGLQSHTGAAPSLSLTLSCFPRCRRYLRGGSSVETVEPPHSAATLVVVAEGRSWLEAVPLRSSPSQEEVTEKRRV